jgi:predicted oxidoreductase
MKGYYFFSVVVFPPILLFIFETMNNQLIAGCMRWGSWGTQFTTTQMQEYILFCMENGITVFDHADIYGDYTTEADFGKAFAGLALQRNQVQLITKCGIERPCSNKPEITIKKYNTSKQYIIQQAEQSLLNLKTDYIDLLLIHRPNPLMDGEVIADAFTTLQQQGKVKTFGVSNFSVPQLDYLRSYFPKLVANQIELSWRYNEPFSNGQVMYHQQHQIATQAWSPLGNIANLSDEEKLALQTVAHKYDLDMATLLLVWLWHHPAGIAAVIGTTNKQRMTAAIKAQAIAMRDEDWFAILKVANGLDVA